MHILGKISKNEEAGILDEWGEKALVEYQAIVEEYSSKCRGEKEGETIIRM